jgi:hypothetical protein
VTIIPRKFNNSKGQNFFTEVQNTKRLNRLMRELKSNHEANLREAKQNKPHNNKKK